MKIYRLLLFALLLSSCKTQHIVPLVLKDSVSVTYKQGKVVSLAELAENAEQERNNICELGDEEPRDSYRSLTEANSLRTVPQSGTTMPQEKSVKSASSARAIKLRVDTVFVERWHTEQAERLIGAAASSLKAGRSRDRPQAQTSHIRHHTFYQNCTIGFFILILLLLGRIAFRIMKAIYLRK